MREKSLKNRLVKFCLGICLLLGLILLVMFAPVPPGITGDVIRHNQFAEIDATPLIYSDLDYMQDLESEVHLVFKPRKRLGNIGLTTSIPDKKNGQSCNKP